MPVSVNLTIKIGILIAIGYAGARAGIIDKDSRDKLSDVLVRILLPVSMIASSQQEFSIVNAGGAVEILFLALIYYIIMFGSGIWILKLLGRDKRRMAIEILLVTFANTAFLGIPVLSEIAGDVGVLYAVVFNCVFDLVYFSIGMYMLQDAVHERKSDFKITHLLKDPLSIVAITTIILYMIPYRFPGVITESLDLLGNAMMPVSMLIIGAQISCMNYKELFVNKRAFMLSIMKMLIIPMIVLGVMRLIGANMEITATMVILSAMPSGSLNIIMAEKYRVEPELATSTVMQTTLVMLVTLPLFTQMIG
ncbi:MAG: AEC family transporter [Butyrivibrio sp.]|uniref:AEC family transporter n=1 Tax=Butyrivibrio sp. TaxID=28121 RepID=UPI0025EE0594|nr:AEC family transporter [Butyrivibrio sp.]MCR5770068.1 AEC family transporter [Butyrivibrio sp.]